MACTTCEQIPDELPAACDVFLWPPLGHSLRKIVDWQPGPGLTVQYRPDSLCFVVGVAAGALSDAMTVLAGLLSTQELADTKALVLAPGLEPGFQHFRDVTTLQTLIARHQSAWLMGLLRENRVFSLFQPIVSAENPTHPFAYEALLRGVDPAGATLPAYQIFDAARHAGLSFQLDLAARLSAVSHFKPAAGQPRLFINFSPSSIYDPEYCLRSTMAKLNESGISPERVVFEVVESEEHRDLQHLHDVLGHYRRSGFSVALDDFGAGYNGVNLLERLQPDFVKFDMHMIRDIDKRPTKALILADLVGLCQKLGIRTLAEGIETAEELAVLRETGVELLQGYYFGRPQRL